MVGLFKHPKRQIRKLLQSGDYDEAISLGKSLENQYQNDSDFHFIMGSVFFILDDFKKALPYFEKSISLNPDDVETLRLKTNTHLALQEKDAAIKCCKKIIQLDPKNSEAQDLLEQLENL
jgi:tetratricopeptide (TPR) repeat protein